MQLVQIYYMLTLTTAIYAIFRIIIILDLCHSWRKRNKSKKRSIRHNKYPEVTQYTANT